MRVFFTLLILSFATQCFGIGANSPMRFVSGTGPSVPTLTCTDLGNVGQPITSSTGTISLGQYSTSGRAHAQFFTPSENITLCAVTVQLKRPTGTGGIDSVTITAAIYSDDGGDVPTKANLPDSVIATSTTTILQSDLTTSLVDYTFYFNDLSLTTAVGKYWIVVDPYSYSSTDYVQLSIADIGSGTQPLEERSDYNGSVWGSAAVFSAVSPIKIWGKE